MCTFHDKKDKHDKYRGKDCKKNLKALEKPQKAPDGNNQPMISLTPKENEISLNQTNYVVCQKASEDSNDINK